MYVHIYIRESTYKIYVIWVWFIQDSSLSAWTRRTKETIVFKAFPVPRRSSWLGWGRQRLERSCRNEVRVCKIRGFGLLRSKYFCLKCVGVVGLSLRSLFAPRRSRGNPPCFCGWTFHPDALRDACAFAGRFFPPKDVFPRYLPGDETSI